MAGLARGFGPCSRFQDALSRIPDDVSVEKGSIASAEANGRRPQSWGPLEDVVVLARISGAYDSPDRAIQGSLRLNDVMNEKLAP